MIKKDDMLQKISELVAIKSISGEAEGDFPYGKAPFEALQYVIDLCSKLGFKTGMHGNCCGFAEIGNGEEMLGILVHVDVVPAGSGWETDPFKAEIKGDKIFGRGVIDDKGPTIAVIYALKDILDSGVKLEKRIRIIFGTSEETGDGGDIECYKHNEECPNFGFTPDADFPVVYAEKGIAEVKLYMDLQKSGIISAVGGIASNVVADNCEIEFLHNGEKHKIVGIGKSAHGSMPWLGENAIGICIKKLLEFASDNNTEFSIAKFYDECIGLRFTGKGLGCEYSDEESGATTVNPGIIEIEDNKVVITLDIRCSISYEHENLIDLISEKVNKYGVRAKLTYWEGPVYTDKNSPFVQDLMKAYREVSGRDEQPLTMGGGTYARTMENIVAFGPVFPRRECTEHQANEYVYIKDLYQAREIYKKAIENICTK